MGDYLQRQLGLLPECSDQLGAALQRFQTPSRKLADRAIVVGHRRHGGVKKNGPQSIGRSRGGWTTKIHMVSANARTAITFCLSAGQAHDAPERRKLLTALGPANRRLHLIMDRAYEGDETRQLALDLGFIPVVVAHGGARNTLI
jgi:hypothetical protein